MGSLEIALTVSIKQHEMHIIVLKFHLRVHQFMYEAKLSILMI